MCLFRKKRKDIGPKKFDFSGYEMKLTIKSICYFERLTGMSFLRFADENSVDLLYAVFITSNPQLNITRAVFGRMLEDERIAKWMVTKFKGIMDKFGELASTRTIDAEQVAKEEEGAGKNMTDMATSLIIDYGLDAHYVMYEMGLWEIEALFAAAETNVKRHMEEQRLWTYLEVMPHIDGKKCKGPQDLLPFEWEKETKKKKLEEDLKNNMYAIQHTIGSNIFGNNG